jgi:hypothetical protein
MDGSDGWNHETTPLMMLASRNNSLIYSTDFAWYEVIMFACTITHSVSLHFLLVPYLYYYYFILCTVPIFSIKSVQLPCIHQFIYIYDTSLLLKGDATPHESHLYYRKPESKKLHAKKITLACCTQMSSPRRPQQGNDMTRRCRACNDSGLGFHPEPSHG